jgi:hypothetical protein
MSMIGAVTAIIPIVVNCSLAAGEMAEWLKAAVC